MIKVGHTNKETLLAATARHLGDLRNVTETRAVSEETLAPIFKGRFTTEGTKISAMADIGHIGLTGHK